MEMNTNPHSIDYFFGRLREVASLSDKKSYSQIALDPNSVKVGES